MQDNISIYLSRVRRSQNRFIQVIKTIDKKISLKISIYGKSKATGLKARGTNVQYRDLGNITNYGFGGIRKQKSQKTALFNALKIATAK